ncbi:GlsB/YeaQ/YmgE family stress response membrane protein [Ramlibacter solisilvae]
MRMMSIIGTIVVGFIVGLIARALKPGDDRMGLIMTTLLGVAGAFIARYVGVAMGWYQQEEAAGWIASVIGAVVLLFIYGMLRGRSRDRP